jgi:hypothetical protein
MKGPTVRARNARPELTFRPGDQRFLQIVSFAVHLKTEDFFTKFAREYCERASDEFWGYRRPPHIVKSEGSRTRRKASNEQRARSEKDQTKIVALVDLII